MLSDYIHFGARVQMCRWEDFDFFSPITLAELDRYAQCEFNFGQEFLI